MRVIEFTHVLAGPFASTMLADLGAEVSEGKPPRRGDTTRHNPFGRDLNLFSSRLR